MTDQKNDNSNENFIEIPIDNIDTEVQGEVKLNLALEVKEAEAKEEEKPSADEEEKPSADEEEKPSADEEEKPSADEEEKPSVDEEEKPSADEEEKPSADEEEKPSADEEVENPLKNSNDNFNKTVNNLIDLSPETFVPQQNKLSDLSIFSKTSELTDLSNDSNLLYIKNKKTIDVIKYKLINKISQYVYIDNKVLLSLLTYAMELMEQTEIKGSLQKDLVIKILNEVIEINFEHTENPLKLQLIEFLNYEASNIIDLIVDASKGKINININKTESFIIRIVKYFFCFFKNKNNK